ncbi:MAG: hypothetical protein JWR61_4150 [Ferruginibacter sp.]|jgi:uncharacterized protein YecE (DUF72 family)|uniref:DUF72 domain-containing protein n=1 Tax=Ferruginibacter sp. TaxID=1940288 RepID=UPI002659B80A|nr:DUF72 domain-containing protein [Ferruginibacter sp.]MDB5279195.1 hypothetical protein [Ferruginibacter sp.]
MVKKVITLKVKTKRPGIFRVGTSNVVLPGNKQSFPTGFQHSSRLQYYGSLFNTVELNSTFYKLPRLSTFEKWAQEVNGNFSFTIKLSKEITHGKELRFDPEKITEFMTAAAGIGNKAGCLLIQFPGKITLDYFAKVENIFEQLAAADQLNQWRKAVEFRSAGWYIAETYELLNEYGMALVLHDISKGKNSNPVASPGFIYCRFHGPTGDYRGSYSDAFLLEQSIKIKGWLKEGKDVFAYFNNTMGNAFTNALTLHRMVEA